MFVALAGAWLAGGLVGCGRAATALPDGGAPEDLAAGGEPGDAARPSATGTYLLTLDAGAFPPTAAHPSALVYVPRNFDPTPPIQIVVFLHGFSNCVENVVRDAGAECTPGGGTRAAYALAAQLEATGKNAILVCPEVLFDQSAGNPGNLGVANGWKALLTEVLANVPLGAGIGDVGTVGVASHSGGYQAAAAIANKGGVPVAELYLLDSLYGNTADFDTWAKAVGPGKRFADVYTSGGGTLANSQAMA